MKKLFTSALFALTAIILATMSSCTDKKTTEMLSVVGDDAICIVSLKPIEILKSCDASISDGKLVLPPALKRSIGNSDELNEMLKIKGISYDMVIAAMYDTTPDAIIIIKINDAEELATSLKKTGYSKSKIDGHVVFAKDESSTAYTVSDNLLIGFSCWRESDREEYIERIFDFASTPLAGWKTAMLSKLSSSAISGLVISPERKFEYSLAFSADLSGSKLSGEARWYDLDGKAVSLAEECPVELAYLGSEMKYVSDKDLIAGAWGGFKDMSVYKAIDKYDLGYAARRYTRGIDDDILKALNGGFFFSLNMENPASTKFESMKDFQISCGVTTCDGKGARMLKSLASMGRDMGLNIKGGGDGYTVKIPGQGTIEVTEAGNCIVVATADKSPNSRLSASSLDDCYAWYSVNIPAGFGLLRKAHINCGFKGQFKITDECAKFNAEFTDNDGKGFLATIIEVSQKLEKY